MIVSIEKHIIFRWYCQISYEKTKILMNAIMKELVIIKNAIYFIQ